MYNSRQGKDHFPANIGGKAPLHPPKNHATLRKKDKRKQKTNIENGKNKIKRPSSKKKKKNRNRKKDKIQ